MREERRGEEKIEERKRRWILKRGNRRLKREGKREKKWKNN